MPVNEAAARGPRVLLLEDDVELADLVVRLLQADGADVTGVRDLQAALHAALTRQFDVLVLDRRVPDGDGVELLARLRGRGVGTPALVLTALGSVRDRVEGLDLGADDYLVKPFDAEELLARVRALLRRHLDAADAVPLGAGWIDNESLEAVRSDGSRVELSPAEASLLLQLCRRPNRVFSREELRATLSPDSNSASLIDTHVYSIRRKLGAEAVRTVRGIGYRAGHLR